MTDPLLRLLADLPESEPDRARAARVRARCHSTLARGRRSRAARQRNGRRLTESVLAGLGGLYLLESVRQALHMLGIA